MVTSYPPERHVLRDLRFMFDEHGDGTSVAWLPVVPEVCTDMGSVRAGALATLVDVLGGGAAATAAHPNWIATADLTVHLVRRVAADAVEARARVLRAGRTTVVIDVTLQKWLVDNGIDPNGFDLFTTPFEANGSGFDQLLDSTTIAPDGTITISDGTTTQTTTVDTSGGSATVSTTTTSGSASIAFPSPLWRRRMSWSVHETRKYSWRRRSSRPAVMRASG